MFRWRAHPRVCGADVRPARWIGAPLGLIPACAGQTVRADHRHERQRAHPRVCGADVRVFQLGVDRGGLIPACAGQTVYALGLGTLDWAHPRVCGADAVMRSRTHDRAGSSPRVRGRLLGVVFVAGFSGLIPACAGQTTRLPIYGQQRVWLIPACAGQTFDPESDADMSEGSSPRVRGRRALRRWCARR